MGMRHASTDKRLNPCAHCGSKDVWVNEFIHGGSVTHVSFSAACHHCGVGTISCREPEEAIAKFNRRWPRVDRETVELVQAAKCMACGVYPYEHCNRHVARNCLREHLGGTRDSTEPR